MAHGEAEIAIVGMAGRFPGAAGVEELWANLRKGVESVEQLRDEDLAAAGVAKAVLDDPRYVKARGVLQGLELFDAGFFAMSPREAQIADPQHRLFLECAWEALERAGYAVRGPGTVGVFAGAGADGYLRHHVVPSGIPADGLAGFEALLGNDRDHLATRVAYKLDLRGPCMTVQTACSTSLVAVQLACQSLLTHQCDMSLAGGVSIAFPLNHGYLHQQGHILSPDGRCRAFDAKAEGPVGGDGAGVVLLKRLSDALADGDHIHAVILAAAVNNDGAGKAGYAAPSIQGQAEVVALAHAIADVSARTIGYVEAHGTGTPLGDPIEIAALTQAFRVTTPDRGFCALGSIKPSLGHLNAAAGVASLIKAALVVERGEIPASLHYSAPNPEIDFAGSPFFVNTELRPWPSTDAGEAPRRAGVSSFGVGGTNAHVVLQEAPQSANDEPARPWQILVLSARSAPALAAASARLAEYLESETRLGSAGLADVAYTLQVGRRAFAHRRSVICREPSEAAAALRVDPFGEALAETHVKRQVFFLFPGQGAQRAGMGNDIYQSEIAFREYVDRAADLLRPHLGLDLRDAMFGDGEALQRSAIAEPALFTFTYALSRLWMTWGVRPDAMLGHGSGEWVAACLAGVFSFDDALRLVTARGKLMDAPGPVAETFAADVARVGRRPPEIPWISNLTGDFMTQAEATDPMYWARHLREPLRFGQGLARLTAAPGGVLLEIGPGGTLSATARCQGVPLVSPLSANGSHEPEPAALLSALGRLWTLGVEVDWAGVHGADRRRRRPLPTYPFQRERHWIDAPGSTAPSQADALEEIDEIEARLRRDLAIAPMESYPGLEAALDQLCSGHVAAFLRSAAVDLSAGAVYGRETLRKRLGVTPKFHRLLDAMLDMLAADGVLSIEGDDLRFLKSGHSIPRPEALRDSIADRFPQFIGLLEFVEHCTKSYPEALTGRREAISVLYPGGSAELVQKMARRTAEYRSERIYIGLLRDFVLGLLTSQPERKLRILEAGGGQGMLTWPLVSALAMAGADRISYHFTDLGKSFVADARLEAERRGLSDLMTFGLLDISKDPDEQGYAGQSFDVVVAYNVVHAARDVPQALDHLGRLLAQGGILGLGEAVRLDRWDVLTWGLAEGFWYYDDKLRSRSPLLPLNAWEDALRAQAFADVQAYPRAPGDRARADHGLILGRRNAAARPVQPRIGQAAPGRHPRPELRTPYVAPRSDLERKIATLCEDLFGIERIGVRDDFFELGADSLVTLRLADMIRRELGREVPADVAFRGATVERIAGALTADADPHGVASPLVPIQTTGSRPPLFFVHPVLGVAFPYVGLARELGADQPFYGIQALGLDGQTHPRRTLEDTAAAYVEAIRTIAPSGPYYLGGYSFGCIVAFEMAQQLSRCGENVALLALVDGPAPVPGYRPTVAGLAKLLTFGVARSMLPHLHDYLYLANASKRGTRPVGGGLEGIVARAMIANFIPADSRLLALRQPAMMPMFRVFAHHVRQAREYEPRPYAGRVSFFKSAADVSGLTAAGDPTMGWSQLTPGGIDWHAVSGEHIAMLRPPHVRDLADKLSLCLRREQDRG